MPNSLHFFIDGWARICWKRASTLDLIQRRTPSRWLSPLLQIGGQPNQSIGRRTRMYHRQSQIMTTVPDSNNRARSRRRYLAGSLVLIVIGLLPASQALPPPPPGGGYPGQNTALGDYSLKVNTTGQFNTAIGFNALQANTT